MEIVIGLIILIPVLLILGLMALGAFGIGWAATSGGRAKRQAAEASDQFAEKFDGDTRLVTFPYSTLRSHPTQAEIIEAADAAGYHLTNTTSQKYGGTLVFEKREG